MTTRLSVLALALTPVLAGCSGGSPTAAPAPSPSASPVNTCAEQRAFKARIATAIEDIIRYGAQGDSGLDLAAEQVHFLLLDSYRTPEAGGLAKPLQYLELSLQNHDRQAVTAAVKMLGEQEPALMRGCPS